LGWPGWVVGGDVDGHWSIELRSRAGKLGLLGAIQRSIF
jgi:hypothetical protein